jgi:Holliday junction resolvasome RuvABC DNA-binding subunit
MSLKTLVEQHNRMDRLFGGKDQWSTTPDAKMAQAMFRRLDSNLSPEVVYQDGERRGAAAQKFSKAQHEAIKDLKALGFAPVEQMYNV